MHLEKIVTNSLYHSWLTSSILMFSISPSEGLNVFLTKTIPNWISGDKKCICITYRRICQECLKFWSIKYLSSQLETIFRIHRWIKDPSITSFWKKFSHIEVLVNAFSSLQEPCIPTKKRESLKNYVHAYFIRTCSKF